MAKRSKSSRWESICNALGFGRSKGCGAKCHKGRSLRIDPLEERALLSLCVWDGGSAVDSNWMTADNWVGDAIPQAGDTLQFAGSTRTATENDFTADTSFAAIEFTDDNFTISGNDLTLTSGITVDTGVSGSTISLDIALGGAVTVSVADSESLAISSVLSGSNSLTKDGEGTLILSGNNTYSGGTTLDEGAISFATGGLSSSGTITLNSTALQWSSGNTQDVSSRLSIQAGAEAVLDVGCNTVEFTDPITTDSGNPGSFTKAGVGSLSLSGSEHFGGVTISAGTLEVRGANIATLSYGEIENDGLLGFV